MELEERIAVSRGGFEGRRPIHREKQARERVEDVVEVPLRVLFAEPRERGSVDRELRRALVRQVDARVPLGLQLLGELEKRGVDVDGSLPEAELFEVVDHDARHDPVLIVGRHLHAAERRVLAKDVVDWLLQQQHVRGVSDEGRHERSPDENELHATESGERNGDPLEPELPADQGSQRDLFLPVPRRRRRLHGNRVIGDREQQPRCDRDHSDGSEHE
jgi:hypothetical protein